jgi:hypothetical protein
MVIFFEIGCIVFTYFLLLYFLSYLLVTDGKKSPNILYGVLKNDVVGGVCTPKPSFSRHSKFYSSYRFYSNKIVVNKPGHSIPSS